MCGIFCAICGSSDEALSKRKKIEENIKPFLARRGPDHFGEKQFNPTMPHNEESEKPLDCKKFIHLAAVVLHIRGCDITKQPVEDSFGNVLSWNGEVFSGLDVPDHESDTSALLNSLHSMEKDTCILKTMSNIHGPWAFVYYQASQQTLWFGRDYFGRRSLLWHLPSSPSDLFALTSVGTRFAEKTGEQFWREVPTNGIYSVDLQKLGEYFSRGDENTANFQDVLRIHSWKHSSSEYPACPVLNPFNGEIPKPVASTCTSTSTSNSEKPCLSLCGGESLGNCQLSVFEYEPNVSASDCYRHEEVQQDSFTSFTSENEQIPTTDADNHDDTVRSGKLSRDIDQNDRICSSPSDLVLEKQIHKGSNSGLCISEKVVEQFTSVLLEAVRKRVFNLLRKSEAKCKVLTAAAKRNDCNNEREGNICEEKLRSKVGILFSGGLDSIVLAALADRYVPPGESIDLINVAFEQKSENKQKNVKKGRKHKHDQTGNDGSKSCRTNFEVPDRVTGRSGVAELININPRRRWNFIEVNVTLEELQKERSTRITHLVSPQNTVLDDSIGCALWFAARGEGNLTCADCLEKITEKHSSCDHHPLYTCPAKVLLLGMGADEQLGGYARHRSRFNREGWKGLMEEIEMEVQRISERNLGRDDRCVSDHGRESRFPFLDEDVVSFLNGLPVFVKCDPRLPRGIGEKIILRQVAKSIGLTGSSVLPKRAIQFGSRIAKLESSCEKGSEKCNRF